MDIKGTIQLYSFYRNNFIVFQKHFYTASLIYHKVAVDGSFNSRL